MSYKLVLECNDCDNEFVLRYPHKTVDDLKQAAKSEGWICLAYNYTLCPECKKVRGK